MSDGVGGDEGDAVAVGVGEGGHAEVVAAVEGGDAGEAAAVVPLDGDAIGDDEVEGAGAEAGDDGLAAGGTGDFAFDGGEGDADAAVEEVAGGLGPDGIPEVADVVGAALGVAVEDVVDGEGKRGSGCRGGERNGGKELEEYAAGHRGKTSVRRIDWGRDLAHTIFERVQNCDTGRKRPSGADAGATFSGAGA